MRKLSTKLQIVTILGGAGHMASALPGLVWGCRGKAAADRAGQAPRCLACGAGLLTPRANSERRSRSRNLDWLLSTYSAEIQTTSLSQNSRTLSPAAMGSYCPQTQGR